MLDAALIEGMTPGAEWDAVFATGPGLQSGRDWFATVAEAACPAGARPAMLQLRQDGVPCGLLPLLLAPGPRTSSLTSPYTVLFQPLLDPADARRLGRQIGRRLRGRGVVMLEALDPTWPGLTPLLAGLRRAGLFTLRFDQFGNWHENVAGLSWETYLARRPGRLRETIRRKGRLAARADVRFEVVREASALAPALSAYEAVYARSWKVPEPFPAFASALLHRLAPTGRMRLGLLWQGDVPLAAQYWTVDAGVATVMKLAHDETARALSPGTLLTAHMVRMLLGDGVQTLDFGRGDDPYKQQWAATRRQRIGVVLANPLHPAGMATLGRHWAGRLTRGLRR